MLMDAGVAAERIQLDSIRIIACRTAALSASSRPALRQKSSSWRERESEDMAFTMTADWEAANMKTQ